MRQIKNHQAETTIRAERDTTAGLIAALQAFMAADFESEIGKAIAREPAAYHDLPHAA